MATLPSLSDLHIPKQTNEKSWFDVRTKQIAVWIDALPLGDNEETTKQLYAVLSHLNRVQLPAPVRLKTMLQLQNTFNHCVQTLKSQYLGHSFPLKPRALRAADRTIAMLGEIAISYKITAIELQDHNRLFRNKLLSATIYKAVESLNELLMAHYQVYAPEPPRLWNEIHTLYSFAETEDLHKTRVRDIETDNEKQACIQHKYKETLLLALSNPYHLRRNEIDKVHLLVKEWATYTNLINPQLSPSGEANFVTCLKLDRPPVELGLIKTLEDESCRFLNTSNLTQHLRYLLSQETEEQKLSSVSGVYSENNNEHLLKQLIAAWDSRGKRSFSRSPVIGSIDLSIGLNSTHFLIEECNRPPVEEPEEIIEEDSGFIDDTKNPLDINHTTFSIEPIPGEADGEQYWDRNPNSHVRDLTPLANANDPTLEIKPTYNYQPWKTLNISAGGYCLLWDHDNSSNAQIGEIVGIKETGQDGENAWRIGVVRWMQYLRHQGLKLGIQILSPNATTIQSRLLKGRASKKKEYSCLGLPEMKAMHQPASILTPALHYKVGDALILNNQGNLMNVQLTRLVENTGNFARFQYAPLNTREDKAFEEALDLQTNEWKF